MAKKREFTDTERAFFTGHFPYLAQAVIVAARRVPAWRRADNGMPYSILDLYELAKPYDEKRKKDDLYYFMVTSEGAIGISTGPEYLTRWLFLPMEPGEERNAFLKEYAAEYDRIEAEASAEEAEEKAANAPKKRICPHCGAEIKNPKAKFCGSCGHPL